MVKEKDNLHICEACDMKYKEKGWAEKCEKSCTEKKML